MRRIDLFEATMQGWMRLDAGQRERFFKAGLKAALRLDRLEFRAWLLRRVRTAPLAAPINPAAFFGSRHGLAAETITPEAGGCRSRHRTVGTLPLVFVVWSASHRAIISSRPKADPPLI